MSRRMLLSPSVGSNFSKSERIRSNCSSLAVSIKFKWAFSKFSPVEIGKKTRHGGISPAR